MNNAKKFFIIAVVLCVVSAVLFAGSLILFLNSRGSGAKAVQSQTEAAGLATREQQRPDTSSDETRDANTEMTLSESQTPTQGDASAQIIAPDDMVYVLESAGGSLDGLSEASCSQLVTVSSSGSSAQIDFYSLENNEWVKDDSLSCSGFVGYNGVTANMHEGGNASPWGVYGIGEAFYLYQKPETGLNSFEITNGTYWVDDPNSVYYNRKVVGTDNMDWNSAEHMWEISNYEYGFVIDYNPEAIPNAGSAIFFHVSSSPTAGCIGTDKGSVLGYLAALDASKNPRIAII